MERLDGVVAAACAFASDPGAERRDDAVAAFGAAPFANLRDSNDATVDGSILADSVVSASAAIFARRRRRRGAPSFAAPSAASVPRTRRARRRGGGNSPRSPGTRPGTRPPREFEPWRGRSRRTRGGDGGRGRRGGRGGVARGVRARARGRRAGRGSRAGRRGNLRGGIGGCRVSRVTPRARRRRARTRRRGRNGRPRRRTRRVGGAQSRRQGDTVAAPAGAGDHPGARITPAPSRGSHPRRLERRFGRFRGRDNSYRRSWRFVRRSSRRGPGRGRGAVHLRRRRPAPRPAGRVPPAGRKTAPTSVSRGNARKTRARGGGFPRSASHRHRAKKNDGRAARVAARVAAGTRLVGAAVGER